MAQWQNIDTHVTYSKDDYNDSRAIVFTNTGNNPLLPVQQQSLLGTVKRQLDLGGTGTRKLKFVQLQASAATLAANDVVGFYNTAHTVVTTVVASYISRNSVGGVAIGAITAGNYGWILCKGLATVNLKSGVSGSKGESIFLSDTTVVVDRVALGTATTYKSLGFAMADGSGSGGTIVVQVDCE